MITSTTLKRLAALNLGADALNEVLAIIAEVQSVEDERREKAARRQRVKRARDDGADLFPDPTAIESRQSHGDSHANVTVTVTPESRGQADSAKKSPDPYKTTSSLCSEVEEHDGGDAREPLISDESEALADEVAAIAGLDPDPRATPPGWCGAASRVKIWLDGGWHPDVIRAAVRATMIRKRDGPPDTPIYFEKPIARLHAQQGRPLPVATIPHPESFHVGPSQRSENSIIGYIKQSIAERTPEGRRENDPGGVVVALRRLSEG